MTFLECFEGGGGYTPEVSVRRVVKNKVQSFNFYLFVGE